MHKHVDEILRGIVVARANFQISGIETQKC